MKSESHNQDANFSRSTLECLEQSKDVFHTSPGYFESNEALLNSKIGEHMHVESDYFDNQTRSIAQTIQTDFSSNRKGRVIRILFATASAAAFVGVLFLAFPREEANTSFAQELEQAQLDYEDLEAIEFDEEVYDEFIVLDTLVTDTVQEKKGAAPIHDFKPSKGQSVITWDDIDAEDIEEYLNEEESLNIIDEL
jgi:hypothetical protein